MLAPPIQSDVLLRREVRLGVRRGTGCTARRMVRVLKHELHVRHSAAHVEAERRVGEGGGASHLG